MQDHKPRPRQSRIRRRAMAPSTLAAPRYRIVIADDDVDTAETAESNELQRAPKARYSELLLAARLALGHDPYPFARLVARIGKRLDLHRRYPPGIARFRCAAHLLPVLTLSLKRGISQHDNYPAPGFIRRGIRFT